jgi:hypothetical protein
MIPRTLMIPVIVHMKGRQHRVLICERCKEIKENEQRNNGDNAQ